MISHDKNQVEREFFIDNLLVRIHFIIVMIRWTSLALWVFESPFSGSLTSTFLEEEASNQRKHAVWVYRGTSRIRNCDRLGPYSRTRPRALWRIYGVRHFVVSEVPR